MVTPWSELRLGRMPWSSASWIAGMPWPIAISIGGAERDVAAGVLDQPPGRVAEMRAVDVFIARPQQPGAAELGSAARIVADADARRRGTPTSRASAKIFASRSPPSASVSNWSLELK